MKSVMVTGGAGFIGSNFIKYLLKKHVDISVCCVDCLSYAGNIKSIEEHIKSGEISFFKCSITDKKQLSNIFEMVKPDIVVNFAAESHVDRSIRDSSIFLMTNIIGVGILLECCSQYGVERFHQVSTDEVYGDLPINSKDKFRENSILKASSPYAASKVGAEMLVMSYKRTYKVPISISRCSNNYGPFHHTEKFIPKMITQALTGKKLQIYGDGSNVRDWIHVEDHCNALEKIIFEGREGEIYNIGGDCEKNNIYVANLIVDFLGISREYIEFVSDRPGHDRRYAIDASKIRKELGWFPTKDFSLALQETIKWYEDNRTWWENLQN